MKAWEMLDKSFMKTLEKLKESLEKFYECFKKFSQGSKKDSL